jgi:hypothetical protein
MLQDPTVRGLFLRQWDKLDPVCHAESFLLPLEVLEDVAKLAPGETLT